MNGSPFKGNDWLCAISGDWIAIGVVLAIGLAIVFLFYKKTNHDG